MAKTVCIVGTMDTKGVEFSFIKAQIESAGVSTCVINTGILGEPQLTPDVSADEVAQAGGSSLQALRDEGDRGNSVAVMAEGAAALIAEKHAAGEIDGIISLGGSAGTTIGTTAMQAVPVGVPKIMVSTLASGDTSPYVQSKDISMMYSVVDIAGINRLSRQILANAAGAIVGMVNAEVPAATDDKPLIAATMFGVTTPCVTKAREILEAAGYEVLVFHATGTGGQAMEDLVKGGFLAGVLDVTTTELADELVGGILSAGPDRLEAAGESGLPQVVSPGALDMVNFGPPDTVPEQFSDRLFYQHNPTVTLMRTTAEETAELGRIMARKLSEAQGPTTVIIPTQGVSAIDKTGQPFDSPEARTAWIENLKAHIGDNVTVIEMEAHINDDEFATKLAETLLESVQ
ncbi:MAG: Tm-1-like ATP-binding domain-containing protein [Candidatus Poribacteria bacterium]|nr:Tm-1-like ATP-binding domain-containing protein [Candidatus Poribacteria bacterium]MDD9974515.1 Tm-1-like ATP-binding domain-containing protein [Candidatus Poribacteria bacterium]MDE0325330.1 Tm-1-like ATP-binding domain-containing protein [Candidatus Poribacteria bacterium]